MLATSREEVNRLAEQLAILHRGLTDADGLLVCAGRADFEQYSAAVMAALVMLSGGEAIGYQGDTHIRGFLPGQKTESFTLDKPK